MLNYLEIKNNLDERKQLYPNIYHDTIPLQQLQFINSFLGRHDLPSILSLTILSLYEEIASKLFKVDKKTGQNKAILLKGTERKVVIAHCIYKICTSKNIQCDAGQICRNMGISKKRMINIHQRYNLDEE